MDDTKEYLSGLNESQLEAVTHVEGPLLILAGAGTGKTRVLTSRIINIVDNAHAFPSQILAVTFTNKAASEMRQRVEKYLGDVMGSMNIGTFHSIAAKILRKHAELLGYKSDYTIINQDDQIRLIKQIVKDFGFDEKDVPAKLLLYYINRFKDRAILPENVASNDIGHFANNKIKQLYHEYQDRLKNFNAMDFGDLLLNNITLFNTHLDICLLYQNKFKYMLVDEYQDTNIAQYMWLRILSQNNNNICCVGDDDQSIYAWRGAEISNILRFDKDYKDAKVIRLERNYRSTQHILNIASKLIANNTMRHFKELWTERTDGDMVKVVNYYDDKEEARAIADEIDMLERMKKCSLSDIAVLVRAGYQTRNFEESLNFLGIPYRIIGSTKFYDRTEVKDGVAYIRLLINHDDNLAFERIINVPKRGVGPSTLQNIIQLSKENGISYFAATKMLVQQKKSKSKAMDSLADFINHIETSNHQLKHTEHRKVVEELMEKTSYLEMYRKEDKEDAKDRFGNIKELVRSLEEYESLNDFLQYITLVNDADNVAEDNRVNIMTMHAAKGLEFDTVFLPGWEEGVFPSSKSIEEDRENGLEEERRLAYVAITRAKRNLTISYACYRRVYGDFQASEISRFINELPKNAYQLINNYFNNTYKQNNNHPVIKINKARSIEHAKFGVGEKVEHVTFGKGVVLSADGNVRQVFFEKTGVKKDYGRIFKDSIKMNNMKNIPRHIAIIMDGNGRWAKHNNVPKLMGYQHGIETAQTIIEYVKAIGVQYLTLYAFSLENWQRPKTEVDNLMNMFRSYLTNDIDNLIKNDIRVIFIGQRNKLEADIRDSMLNVEEKSSRNNFKLIIAISYGSRDEVVNTAVQFSKFYDENIKNPDELFASIINPHNIPDPDLLIRTGGEHRLSNFLLWQMAYTELFFIDKFWPDFAKQDLLNAIEDFNKRERKYGK